MKKYFLYVLMLVSVVSMTACEEFLTHDPKDKLTAEQVFASETTLRLYINGLYVNMLPNAEGIYRGDVMTDITVPTVVPDFLLAGNLSATNVAGWDWANLRNLNYFIRNNNNVTILPAVRNHYSGIARLFRAQFYFNMVKRYGDVPWYNQALDIADSTLYKARDSRAMIMDSVLADINFACKNIYLTKDASSTTVTQWVALTLKSRICLFEGTYRKYHPELSISGSADKWLTDAADAAQQVIAGGQYGLVTGKPASDYRSLFINEVPNNREVLLASVYSNALQKWHASTYWYNSPTTGSRLSLDKYFVNTYLNADGTRFTDKSRYDTLTFQKETANRDLRLSQTIRLGSYTRSDGTSGIPNFNVTITGYHILKFSLDNPYYDSRTESSNSIPILRYAEVLLNYAEAKAELGTITLDDWNKTIGALRQRAGITNIAMPTVADDYLKTNFYPTISDPVILEVRRERGIELVGEGFRFDDLLRYKAGKNLERTYTGMYIPGLNQPIDLNGDGKPDVSFVTTKPATTISGVVYVTLDGKVSKLSELTKGNLLWNVNQVKTFADKQYNYPIPYSEILLNPKLKQNTGW